MIATDIVTQGDLEVHTCTAVQSPGDILQTRDGFAAVVIGVNPGKAQWAIGDQVSVATDAFVTLPKGAGTTVADGVRANWDSAAKLVVSTAGNYGLGAAVQTLTTTRIRVRLNKVKLP